VAAIEAAISDSPQKQSFVLNKGSQMDSDKANRWLTLGANIGVLIGIILILIELNQNADLMQAQIAQSRADNRVELYREQMNSDYWPAIYVKRATAVSRDEWIDSLTPEEYQRVRFYTLLEVNDLRTQFLQYQQGYLDRQLFETAVEAQARRLMAQLHYFPDIQISGSEYIDYLNSVARKYNLQPYSPNPQLGE
jgi:hypothetical protein